MDTSNENRTFTLADGRVLGFAEYGDPPGFPVVLFHGTPGSRLVGRISHPWARDIGCHLICTDRPGYGLSSPHAERTLFDHAEDVRQLCDELGVGAFAVAGISGGAPYVLACAAALGERITGGAVMSGFYGLDAPVDSTELPDAIRENFEQLREDPEQARASYDQVQQMVAMDPAELTTQILADSPDAVRALADESLGRDYADHMIEGLRPGSDGAVQDIGLAARPWAIDLAGIKPEIGLWHGGKDPVPRSHVEAVANVLPNGSVVFYDDYGHLDCFYLMPEILERFRKLA